MLEKMTGYWDLGDFIPVFSANLLDDLEIVLQI